MRDISGVPVIKTLLLLDFVDSTRITEELGDELAAEVFGTHDRIARDLLHTHGGQEIDKTDGFLFIFGRPIDATRYALRYHQALNDLAVRLNVPLGARVGIHLGEVVLRANTPEDVARGAKPIELEGLAKPTVARIMSLAVGGQTVMTQTAFDLAHRAAVGDGILDEGVEWLEHGFYKLKGIKAPIKICEVGRKELAPLKAPPDSAKGYRIRSTKRRVIAGALSALAVLAGVALILWGPWRSDVDVEGGLPGAGVAAATDIVSAPPPPRPAPSPRPATLPLRLVTTPPGATLRMDGAVIGAAPLEEPVPAQAGVHLFEASLKGHRADRFRCRITDADLRAGRATCEMTLTPLPKPKPPPATPAAKAPKPPKPKAKSRPTPKRPRPDPPPAKAPKPRPTPKPVKPERRPAIPVID